MARDRTASAPGNWFLLWAMLLLSLWLAPAPESAKRLMAGRALLLLLSVGAAIAASLRLRSDRTGAAAGFVRSVGALFLGAGLWAATDPNAPYVIESFAVRVTLLTIAAACLLTSLVLDLTRQPS